MKQLVGEYQPARFLLSIDNCVQWHNGTLIGHALRLVLICHFNAVQEASIGTV
jgi:hypothetical protein